MGTLSRLLSSRPRRHKHTPTNTPKPNTRTTLPPRALFLPEILEHILSFLSPWYTHSITSLVCKLWFATSRRVAPLPVHLVINGIEDQHIKNKETFNILKQEPRPLIISYVATTCTTSTTAKAITVAQRQEFRNSQTTAIMDGLRQHNQNYEGMPKLEHVVMKSVELWWRMMVVAPVLFGSLTRLRMEERTPPSVYALDVVLKHCFNLVDLFLWQKENFARNVSARYEDEIGLLKETKLKRLVLKNIAVTQRALERLVRACPRLVGLEVNGSTTFFDQPRFYHLVARTCPRMARFHCSITVGDTLCPVDIRLMQILFPMMTEWSFLDSEHSSLPRLNYQILDSKTSNDSITKNMTYLELVKDPGNNVSKQKRPNEGLHTILCHAPNLLHLLAPQSQIYYSQIDIHHFLDSNGAPHHFSQPPAITIRQRFNRQIWACRRLQTLQISFCGQHGTSLSPWCDMVVFGYLVKVCPVLKTLEIWLKGLEAATRAHGIALLSRLEGLETLTMHVELRFFAKPEDFEWLRRPNREQRVTMGRYLQSRKTSLEDGRRVKVVAVKNAFGEVGTRYPVGGSLGRLMVDGVDMSDVGSVDDLRACLGEMRRRKGEGRWCWPRLEYLGVEYPKMVENVRPKVVEEYLREIRQEVCVSFF